MSGSRSLLCVGLLALIISAPLAHAGAQQRRDRDRGGNEIYLPDPERKQFDCTDQCDTFRKACVTFCEDEGHVPGGREPSDDCGKDCKKMQSECFDSCMRSMSFMKPQPAMPR